MNCEVVTFNVRNQQIALLCWGGWLFREAYGGRSCPARTWETTARATVREISHDGVLCAPTPRRDGRAVRGDLVCRSAERRERNDVVLDGRARRAGRRSLLLRGVLSAVG